MIRQRYSDFLTGSEKMRIYYLKVRMKRKKCQKRNKQDVSAKKS